MHETMCSDIWRTVLASGLKLEGCSDFRNLIISKLKMPFYTQSGQHLPSRPIYLSEPGLEQATEFHR
jgi:hypothetical protein